MCVHANGVIVTRMSHSQPWGSALPSRRGQPRAPALPHGRCLPPALGLVLCSLPGHSTPPALHRTWGWESFPFFCSRPRICSESGNSCLETPLCLWGWRAPHVCSSSAAPAWYGISHTDFLQGLGFPARCTVKGAGGRACSRRWGVRASAASPAPPTRARRRHHVAGGTRPTQTPWYMNYK